VLFSIDFLLSFSKNPFIKRLLIAFDGFMFFITGLLGILLIFMWLGTDHVMCKNNFNLLWAWPTNIIAAFYIHSKKRAATAYFKIYAVFNLGTLCLLVFFTSTFESGFDTCYCYFSL
jgi:hypothetical protein